MNFRKVLAREWLVLIAAVLFGSLLLLPIVITIIGTWGEVKLDYVYQAPFASLIIVYLPLNIIRLTIWAVKQMRARESGK